MYPLYDFLAGPGAWIAFLVFFGGLLARGAFLLGLSRGRDLIFHNNFDWGWSLRSIGHWLLPWGSVSWRRQPVFSLAFFLFHLCLIFIPIFLDAHNQLWREAFGWGLPSLPDRLVDWGTILFMLCAAFLLVRRLIRAEVRILSSAWDYLVLLITAAPFVTGFLAYRQIGDYNAWLLVHMFCGELMLVVVPFSKLGHLMLFFFTRAFIASDMGARRQVEGRLGAKVW
jgi:nitrate reductase gamma subunit